MAALQKEGEVPIEDLLKTLPQEVLDKPACIEDVDIDVTDADKEDTVRLCILNLVDL